MPDLSGQNLWRQLFGKPWTDAVLLFIASLTLNLVGNGSFSLIQRDESGYVGRSSAMWKNRQWLMPDLLGEKFIDKPILVFWVQAPVLGLLGDSTFAARLPSAVFGALAVVVIYALGRQLVYYGAPSRWLSYDAPPIRRLQRMVGGMAALLLGSSLLFVFISKWATTDALLLLLTLLIVWLIFRLIFDPPNISRRPDGRLPNAWDLPITWLRAYSLAALVAVSVLLKGPANLAFLVPMGVVLLVLFRPWQALRPWRMWVLAGLFGIALVVPYFWKISQMSQGQFAHRFLLQQVLQRLFIPDNGHFGPPGYYALTSVIALYPWGFLYIWALAGPLVVAWQVWKKHRAERRAQKAAAAHPVETPAPDPALLDPTRSGLLNRVTPGPRDRYPVLHSSSDTLITSPIPGLDTVVVFLLCWFVPGWLFVELLMVTKLPHYLMPVMPALALLLAWRLVDWTVVHRTSALGQEQSLLTSGQWLMGPGGPGSQPVGPGGTGFQPVRSSSPFSLLTTQPFFTNRHLRRLAVICTLLPLLPAVVIGGLMLWQGNLLALLGCILVGLLSVGLAALLWPAVFSGEPLRGVVKSMPLAALGLAIVYVLILPGFEPLRLEVQAARKIQEITPPDQPVLLANWRVWDSAFYSQRPTTFVRTIYPDRQGGPTLKAFCEFLQNRDLHKPLTVLMDADTRALVFKSPELLDRYPPLAPDSPAWVSVAGYEHAGVNLLKGWKRTLWLVVLPAELGR